MLNNQIIRVLVEDLNNDGQGVAFSAADGVTQSGFPLYIPLALPGDLVEAQVVHISPHDAGSWGRLERVLTPSPQRIEPVCAILNRCGGCSLGAWRYESQLEWKRRRVINALRESKVADQTGAEKLVLPCVAAPAANGYRNFSKLIFGREGCRVVLGAYAPRSHRLIDMRYCQAVEPVLVEVAAAMARLATEAQLDIYDEFRGAGGLRYALLRSNWKGEVLVLLVLGEDKREEALLLAQALTKACPSVVGVVGNLNRSRGNVLVGEEQEDFLLSGEPNIEEHIGELRLRLSARSFFQVNRAVASMLYAAVVHATEAVPRRRVIDLFSGAGAIGLTLAKYAQELIGVERNVSAVRDAQASAVLNQVTNIRFVADDAARWLQQAPAADKTCDVLVINPPRKGAAALVASFQENSAQTIIYVSCSPESLARDLIILISQGFSLESVQPYDMLPNTPHIESLSVLRRH